MRTTLVPLSLAVSFSGLGLHFYISDLLLELRSLRSAFPTLIRLLQIALTVRNYCTLRKISFSALKRIKTYLRSTMTEQCLVDLAVLSIERDLSGLLSLDEIIDTGQKQKNCFILSYCTEHETFSVVMCVFMCVFMCVCV